MKWLLLCLALLLPGCSTFHLQGVDLATSYHTFEFDQMGAWPPAPRRSHGANVGVVLRFERKPEPVCCWRRDYENDPVAEK